MENITVKKKFNFRAFVSILSSLCFITLPVSGILMHEARESNNIFNNHLWMGAHNIFAAIFMITVIFHLRYNWKALTGYLRCGMEKAKNISVEFVSGAVIFLAVLGLTILHAYKG